MPAVFFYLFALITVATACAMIVVKNPVTSALYMVASFVGLAAIFVGLNAYFVGIIQILVYAGAIMVLFIFIIMLLDLKEEGPRIWKPTTITAAALIPGILVLQILGVVIKSELPEARSLDLEAAAAHSAAERAIAKLEGKKTRSENDIPKIESNLIDGQLPDVHLVGKTIFDGHGENIVSGEKNASYNLPLQIMGVLLLVATVGVVTLSKKDQSA